MNKELKEFNINLEDIKENNDLFGNLDEAIEKMKLMTLKDRYEVVLNNNLIECKEKLTNYKTILGCRISYDNLDKNISFIIKEDIKPSYEQLEKQLEAYKNMRKEAVDYVEEKGRLKYNPQDLLNILNKVGGSDE